MIAFSSETTYNKSKVFIERALKARDDRDPTSYYLWAALSMELLAKSTLANIHPVLVADPNDFMNLLYACGIKDHPKKRSISASALYERLTHISPEFDEKMKSNCMKMANYRNAELHSGEAPLVGLDHRVWVSKFWRAISLILKMQSKTLSDWVGLEESGRIQKVLEDSSQHQMQLIAARIARKSNEYSERFPLGSSERNEAHRLASLRSAPNSLLSEADDVEAHNCPACNSKAWLIGIEWEQAVINSGSDIHPDYGYTMPWDEVETIFNVEAFRCVECGLILDGREEIEMAGLPVSFERLEIQEPDYEPDYGND